MTILILYQDYNFQFDNKGIVAARISPPGEEGYPSTDGGGGGSIFSIDYFYHLDFLFVPHKNPLLLTGGETGAYNKNS